ncbi:hypothetical protein CKA32_004966 [Geitlerinema sp. FC II]|nr:hypothetical protein CKA32_004966 [Geitlerinema sp. FC II]
MAGCFRSNLIKRSNCEYFVQNVSSRCDRDEIQIALLSRMQT